jgi:hypothetical protein
LCRLLCFWSSSFTLSTLDPEIIVFDFYTANHGSISSTSTLSKNLFPVLGLYLSTVFVVRHVSLDQYLLKTFVVCDTGI